MQQLGIELRKRALRFRTAIVALSPYAEECIARARLDLGACLIDLREAVLGDLGDSQVVVALEPDGVLTRLRAMASSDSQLAIVMVVNADLALAKFDSLQLAYFWDAYSKLLAFAPRALVLAMPATATALLPLGADMEFWKSSKRYADFFWVVSDGGRQRG